MAVYPGDIPPSVQSNPNHTLDEANHTALHNNDRAEIVAISTKIGKDGSADTSSIDYRLSGVAAGDKAMSLTGVETASNKTFNSTTINSPIITTPNVTNPTISGGGSWGGGPTISGSPTISAPIIGDFTNSTHTHANAAGGGMLNGANAITDGTITPAELMSNTGNSWAWQTFSPTWTNMTVGNGVGTYAYIQIGKIVFVRFHFEFGTTSAMGTLPNFTLPVTANSAYDPESPVGVCNCFDDGVASYPGHVRIGPTTGTAEVTINNAGTAYLQYAAPTSTIPFTWGTGDEVMGNFCYEAV